MAKKKENNSLSWWMLLIIPLALLGVWVYTTTMQLRDKSAAIQANTQMVLVYYSVSTETDVDFVAVERGVPKTADVNKLAIETLQEWIKGPTEAQKLQGMYNSLNEGVVVNSVTIEDGKATIDFNDKFDTPMGGSTRVMSIAKSIEKIMKQFGVVSFSDIKLTINNGERAAVLEP